MAAVTIEDGCLQGDIKIAINGTKFFSFLGIPYAKPPIGNLRFKAPERPEPWDGLRDATQSGAGCYPSYPKDYNNKKTGVTIENSEDCLILNVFTHEVLSRENDILKPVMFFIHGGGFTIDSSDIRKYGPEFLMTEDIVLVTINYRLGVFGFLDLYDIEIGNAGLKDIVMALKWVQKNIKYFGGDPDCVTIFGISSGGAAVHYLTLSPLAKGLFHRAIAQSGCALNPWARGRRFNGLELARLMGCMEEDSLEILQFLQKQSADDILKAQRRLGDHISPTQTRYFSPTIEKEANNAFICSDPIEIISSGNFNDVPLIMGYTSVEGAYLPVMKLRGMEYSDTSFVPFLLGLDPQSSNYMAINNKIINFYFKDDKVDPSNLAAIVALATDNLFLRGIYQAIKGHMRASAKPIYFYQMSMDTDINRKSKMADIIKLPGAAHGDDRCYLFKSEFDTKYEPGSREQRGIDCFVKLWTNFAKTGNPTCELNEIVNVNWQPVTTTQMNYLQLGNDLKMNINPEQKRMEFWDDIYKSCSNSY